jgi:hypothetical protein
VQRRTIVLGGLAVVVATGAWFVAGPFGAVPAGPTSSGAGARDRDRDHPVARASDRPISDWMCHHRYLAPPANQAHWEYELVGPDGQRERIELRFDGRSSTESGHTLLDYDTEYRVGGATRSGQFAAACGDRRAELPFDRLPAASTAGDRGGIPRFLFPDQLDEGQELCEEGVLLGMHWQRCIRVISVIDRVETPAGTFDAVHIERTDRLDRDGSQQQVTHLWLAEGVGMVRITHPSRGGRVELVSLTTS